MRKRIRELARGKFESARPLLRFSTDKIELQVLEGKGTQGEFVITSTNQIRMKGMIYSSNSRMECLTPVFEGEEVRIRFEFHSEGLMEGDIQKGAFFIICNQGEYDLSFVVSVLNLNADSTMGAIRKLADFTRLAQERPEEAYRIFTTSYFRGILKKHNQFDERFLYDAIAKSHLTRSNMEAFLVAAGRKKEIQISFPDTVFEYENITEQRQEQIRIMKNQWGFLWMDVSTEDAFLVLSKNRITADDFLGSLCSFSFYLDPEQMHRGKNYGSIVFENAYQKVVVTICASNAPEKTEQSKHREIRRLSMQLMQLYADYRMKKIVTGKWAKESILLLNHLQKQIDSIWIQLLKVQIFLVNGQRQDAEWIMEECKRRIKSESSPEWGYYLYLTTLYINEERYVDKVTDQVEAIYLAHQENLILFWCRLFLREEYVNHSYRRLHELELRIMQRKEENTVLYAEAYYILYKEPYLLKELEAFQMKILNWARKQKILTAGIVERIMERIPHLKGGSRLELLLLEACYEVTETKEMLALLVSYLIRNQRVGRRYFPWYERGIEEKIRVTGLYEAYLASLDPKTITELPTIILMYFKYHNQLPYQQKEILFVNLIAGKTKNQEAYRTYEPALIQFAQEQLEAGRMDDNLAVIYEDVFRDGIQDQETAVQMKRILFTHKITCVNKKIARVIVYTRELKEPQVVHMMSGTGYIQLYTRDYCIVLEDAYGNHYTDKNFYQLEKLMHPSGKIRQCMKFAPKELPYLLYYFTQKNSSFMYTQEEEVLLRCFVSHTELEERYRSVLALRVLEKNEDWEEEIQNFYFSWIYFNVLSVEERKIYVKLLLRLHNLEKAYQLIMEEGVQIAESEDLLEVLARKIEEQNGEEEDSLLRFSTQLYFQGKYNQTILSYLALYYHGPTKRMERLWKDVHTLHAAGQTDLEERILIQMLYTTEFVDTAEEIFESYEKVGKEELKQAYLVYFAYAYFTKDTVVSEHFFRRIEEKLREKEEKPDVFYLAYLKYVCTEPGAEADEVECETYVMRMIQKGYVFDYFRKLGNQVIRSGFLFDRHFVEWSEETGRKVKIHFKKPQEEQYQTDVMSEIFPGLYSKGFTLFFGESIQYYITREDAAGRETVYSGCLKKQNMTGMQIKTKYDKINEMQLYMQLEENENLDLKMQEYLEEERITRNVFRIL